MSLIVGGIYKQFEILDEGVHDAVLGAVQDLGEVVGQFGSKNKVRLVWVSNEPDSEGFAIIVLQSMTNSMHEKSTLRKTIKAILGRDPGEGEFDLESLVGSQAQLVIAHNENEGRTYANVTTVLKAKTTVEIPKNFQPPKVKLQQTAAKSTTKKPYQATNDDVGF
jgi:hypothetical protein